jgi:arsenate reductase (glutaredoxin)
MSKVQIFHNSRCSKSNNAMCFLGDHGMDSDIEVVRYMEQPISKETATNIVNSLSKEFQLIDLVRIADAKKLGIEIPKEVTKEWVINTITTEPKVMQRPIIITNGVATIGRSDEALQSLLK